jgi:uncharacterized protein
MKNQVIKPIASALWLIKNTKLTFNQIANFTGLTNAEINAMADGFEKSSLEPNNPIKIGQLTKEELTRCENNPKAELKLSQLPIFSDTEIKISKKTYVSVARRKEKISGALFLLEKYSNLPIESVMRLTGATKKIVESLINQTYSAIGELNPKDPIISGLCTQVKLNEELAKYSKKTEPSNAQ